MQGPTCWDRSAQWILQKCIRFDGQNTQKKSTTFRVQFVCKRELQKSSRKDDGCAKRARNFEATCFATRRHEGMRKAMAGKEKSKWTNHQSLTVFYSRMRRLSRIDSSKINIKRKRGPILIVTSHKYLSLVLYLLFLYNENREILPIFPLVIRYPLSLFLRRNIRLLPNLS